MEGISIWIQAHKNGIVSVNIHIPSNKFDKECEKRIRVNHGIKNHKETDPGYEMEDIPKIWCNGEEEGRIYDNLD